MTAFHGDAEDIPAEGGFVISAERTNKERRRRSLLLLDINDHIDPASRGWITLDADANEQDSAQLDPIAAERGTRFEEWLLAQDGLSPDQLRLLRMVGEVIRANAPDLESFEPFHFASDPFRGIGGRRRAEQLFGGPASLESLLAGLNAAVFAQTSASHRDAESPRPAA